jgi:hypothetical protein
MDSIQEAIASKAQELFAAFGMTMTVKWSTIVNSYVASSRRVEQKAIHDRPYLPTCAVAQINNTRHFSSALAHSLPKLFRVSIFSLLLLFFYNIDLP